MRKRTFFDQTFTGLPKVRRRKIQMLLECRRKVRGRVAVLHPDFRDAFFFFHLKQPRTSLKAHPLNELIESLIRIRFEHSHQMILGIRTMPGHIIHGDVFVDMLKYVIYRLIYNCALYGTVIVIFRVHLLYRLNLSFLLCEKPCRNDCRQGFRTRCCQPNAGHSEYCRKNQRKCQKQNDSSQRRNQRGRFCIPAACEIHRIDYIIPHNQESNRIKPES